MPSSLGSCAGATVVLGARSGGGTAGGVTGPRSQPPQGPASDAASSVASVNRVISDYRSSLTALVAAWGPRPSLDERLLELGQGGSLA